MDAHPLAHINALLNATAAVLLVLGYLLIRRRREQAHRRVMLSAFATSVVFLASYLAYHFGVLGATTTHFTGEGAVRLFYFVILASHIILAALVPVLAVVTIWFGLRAMPDGGPFRALSADAATAARVSHRRIARWTLPIWLYVSVTGVLVYFMLYYVYPTPIEETML